MTMKKLTCFLITSLLIITGCKNEDSSPDISGVKIDLRLERFDRDFFSIDTTNIPAGLEKLQAKYPQLTPIFLGNILGVDSMTVIPGVRQFLTMSRNLHDTINDVFPNTNKLADDFKKSFQYVKYYFPSYPVPNIITIAGPVDALAQSSKGPTPNFLGKDFMGISLQFYLGNKFSVYHHPSFIEQVAPEFRSRRFSPEYITSDAMQLVVDDLFPDMAGGKPLIDQMIERGKHWYLLDKFLPFVHDTLKTGYTKDQLNWCLENEGLIWSNIVRSEDLYSLNPAIIQTYIGESPFTQGFSQELSPGNIGQWLGWRIVQKYVSKNPGLSPEEIMKTSSKKILDEAKYKPK